MARKRSEETGHVEGNGTTANQESTANVGNVQDNTASIGTLDVMDQTGETPQLTPLEKARLARKTGGGGVRTTFYVIVGINRDGGSQDILFNAKSRRGAEKVMEASGPIIKRNYTNVEVWRCRK